LDDSNHQISRRDTGKTQPIRDLILDAATTLMAEQGTAATTVRDISMASGQNVASVNYYFGSKDLLVREVLYAALAPVNGARIALLDAAEPHSPPEAADLGKILDALIRPLVEARRSEDGGRPVVRLLAHLRSTPKDSVNLWLSGQFEFVIVRFVDALQKALPQMSRSEVVWRYEFIRGATMHILGDLDPRLGRLSAIAGDESGMDDNDHVLAKIIDFGLNGFLHAKL
jgi:AcrR family transcriptional regulator